jgi:hypothetical protein
MQPLPFFAVKQTIQQDIFANPQAPAAHFCSQSQFNFYKTFANPNFAKQGNQESRYEFAARRSLHAGIVSNIFPNEVRWKNPLRHLLAETKNSAACRKSL